MRAGAGVRGWGQGRAVRVQLLGRGAREGDDAAGAVRCGALQRARLRHDLLYLRCRMGWELGN